MEPEGHASEKENPSIFITGAGGFVGYSLVNHWKDKLQIFTVDNGISCAPNRLSNLTFLSDYHSTADISKGIARVPSDIIINLACPASPVAYHAHPVDTILASTAGVINVCEMAIEMGSYLVHFSSSEVYGDSEYAMFEDGPLMTDPRSPRAIYTEGKRSSEAIVNEYVRNKGLQACIVRLFNTYGPWMDIDDGRVITQFMKKTLNGEEIEIEEPGSQTRSFMYIDDLLSAMDIIIRNRPLGIYNLGNPFAHFSISSVAIIFNQLFGAKYKHVPGRNMEIMKRRPSITKFNDQFGWKPEISLEDGLKRMWDNWQHR